MKKCPFCAQLLQMDAHHCHHCNTNLIDMDGNPVAGVAVEEPVQSQWLENVMKVLVTIFLSVQFFIYGIILLRLVLGISIIDMESVTSIIANIFLLIISVAAAIYISPLIINWVKQNFARVLK